MAFAVFGDVTAPSSPGRKYLSSQTNMSHLLVGFDSAWTATNSGAIVAAISNGPGARRCLGLPVTANYREAEHLIAGWQRDQSPDRTIILLDQPTIVPNEAGSRPVERIVSSAVSRRYGGMQPAFRGRTAMFGADAPVWQFLRRFNCETNPGGPCSQTGVFETYPVLAMIAWGWMLPDARPTGRLPKYNPGRSRTFSVSDWEHVCRLAAASLSASGLAELAEWAGAMAAKRPRKADQDALDACLCLLVALHLDEGGSWLMVGNQATGYIVAPQCESLVAELSGRCDQIGYPPGDWLRTVRPYAGL
jgi:predicted RNase H-like nuclease